MNTIIRVIFAVCVLLAFAPSALAQYQTAESSYLLPVYVNQLGTCTVKSDLGYATAWYDTDFSNPPNISGWNWLWMSLPTGYFAAGSASSAKITVNIAALAGPHPTVLASETCP